MAYRISLKYQEKTFIKTAEKRQYLSLPTWLQRQFTQFSDIFSLLLHVKKNLFKEGMNLHWKIHKIKKEPPQAVPFLLMKLLVLGIHFYYKRHLGSVFLVIFRIFPEQVAYKIRVLRICPHHCTKHKVFHHFFSK